MSKATTSKSSIDAIQHRNGRSNWQRYLELLERRGVPSRYQRWYVRHVEAFLAVLAGRNLREIGREEIVAYLDGLARRNPPDWRMRQQVDALRLLLVDLVRNPKAHEVDWDYWAELALRPLPANHPTLARELPPEALLGRWDRGELSSAATAALTRLVRILRAQHYAIRTESAYRDWVRRFLLFAAKSPDDLDSADVAAFLSYLALERRVSHNTQRLALNSLSFFFKHVLERELTVADGFRPARPGRRLPVVLSREEVERLLAALEGTARLMAGLLYGTGMRLMEPIRCRRWSAPPTFEPRP